MSLLPRLARRCVGVRALAGLLVAIAASLRSAAAHEVGTPAPGSGPGVLVARGDLAGALAAFDAVAEASPGAHEAARARIDAARVALALAQLEPARVRIARADAESAALADAGPSPEGGPAAGAREIGLTRLGVGRAWAALARAAGDVAGSDPEPPAARAAPARDDPGKLARAALLDVRARAAQSDDARLEALAALALADLAGIGRRESEALALASEARTIAARAGADDLQLVADARTGLALRALRRDEEALAVLRRTADELARWRAAGGSLPGPAVPDAALARSATQRASPARTSPATTPALARDAWAATDDSPETLIELALKALLDVLLRAAASAPDEASAQALLREVRDVVEQRRVAEVRDWLRDDCAEALAARARSIDEIAGDAAVLHSIVLPDRLVLVLAIAGRLQPVEVAVDEATLAAEASTLRRLLEKRTTREVLAPARAMHERLIAPLLPALDAAGARTLVVVPSGPLRRLPFAALHDGERFLIERSAVATSPGLRLSDPRPLPREGVRALVAGVSSAVGSLPALPHVPEEVAAVHEIWPGELLLDAAFTRERAETRLAGERFDVVHLAAHAELGADVSASHLHASDGPLDLARLAALVEPARHRDRPLELLALSACETASGDEQAALGLAGVAVRAGARSVLGTLWRVPDDAAGTLVVTFHRALREGATRAEALRTAQRALLARPETAHPGVWAAFLLVGSWL